MSRNAALIKEAQKLLAGAEYLVALTGAGVSTRSGIPDFRSAQSGLWQMVDPMEVASICGFRQRPQNFYNWMRPNAQLIMEAKPNAAHLSLAQLEAQGPLKCVITQNIDMLHSKAGSKNLLEVHGHLREATCLQCYAIYDGEPILTEFVATGDVPHCDRCGGVLKPNVILFGELLPVSVLNKAKWHARACDVMLVAGSSLEVAPAGDLPLLAKRSGARLIVVNLCQTHMDDLADVVIHADVVDILPQLAAPFLGQ
jgi:NAD-dependent deacetylase